MKRTQPNENDHCIIAIYADDKKGLLGQILDILNRRNYTVSSLNVSRTDLREIVLITMEVKLPLNELQNLLRKIEKIIEVHHAIAWLPGELELNKVGFYRVSMRLMGDELWLLLQKYGAVVSKIFEDSLVIQKTGTDNDLNELYNLLDGEYLLSFCKSGLIAEKSLVQLDKYFEAQLEMAIA
jgi:acetolactate synthase small subunit